ncbi:FeoB-associated Cys-rich membrane protein [Prevotella sp. PCHR]|uniref:FeoB-associated Cys-rich membrane protein n=1 Tax=Xylanibacter caecicola TaxID=2736294 RepID=A0ABX2B0E2_9BACT|nr:FeoB-associated Cys-rich membrane protein [Xylanibacter caecicola]NPE24696.1 FeoB-associated Cys-rich membrane protein [Xylanibacter caecicola]
MQTIITILIIAVCLVLAGIHIYRTLTDKGNPCSNCPGCAIKKEMEKKKGKNKWDCIKTRR